MDYLDYVTQWQKLLAQLVTGLQDGFNSSQTVNHTLFVISCHYIQRFLGYLTSQCAQMSLWICQLAAFIKAKLFYKFVIT